MNDASSVECRAVSPSHRRDTARPRLWLTSTQPIQRNFTQRSAADNVPPDRGNPVEFVIDQFLVSAYHWS